MTYNILTRGTEGAIPPASGLFQKGAGEYGYVYFQYRTRQFCLFYKNILMFFFI